MDKTVPALEKRVACIAGNASIAAQISSYFNEKNTYFAVFYAPRLWLHEFEPGRKARAIHMLDPQTVIFAGLKPEEEEAMERKLKGFHIVRIRSTFMIKQRLKFLKKEFDGQIKCRSKDFAIGLVHAKRNNLLLIADERAETLNIDLSQGENLIALETEGDLSDVIAANYAFAFGAALKTLNKVERSVTEGIQEQFSEIDAYLIRDPSRSKEVLRAIEENIHSICSLDLTPYKSATFITTGVPYGLIYRDTCPVCHIFRYPDLGRFLFNNLWWEQSHTFLGVGMVFASERFNEDGGFDEVDFVVQKLSRDCHYYAILLEKEKATVEALENFIHFYPMELLHICAHGGEGEGYRCRYEFEDESGKHEMIVDQVITAKPQLAKPDKDGMIRVGIKSVFKNATFDGVPWKESDFKSYPALLRMELMQELEPTRERINYVPQSNQIFCSDGASLGMYHITDLNPVVFNNSCCSISELASSFIFAGARCYIGTCWRVSTPSPAAYVACAFYNEIMNKTLLNSFWDALKLHANPNDPLEWKNYLFFGTHFSTLRPTSIRPKEPLRPILEKKIEAWKARAARAAGDWKRDCERIAEFLSAQLKQFVIARDQAEKEVAKIMPLYNTILEVRGMLMLEAKIEDQLSDDLLNVTNDLIGILQD